MNVVIYSTTLWLLSIIIIVSISSIILYKQKQILTNNLHHKCNKEHFKPYNENYNDGIDIKTVQCSDIICSKAFDTTANITFYKDTKDDANKTITISTTGDISGVNTLTSTDITNSNKITTKDITNTNTISSKDINVTNLLTTNTFKIPDKNNILINGTKLFDLIYPVGSIYMSINATSPATLFGGTWEQIIDRFLYSANSEIGKLGGASAVTLSTDNLPSHNHSMDIHRSQQENSSMYGLPIAPGFHSRVMIHGEIDGPKINHYPYTQTTYTGGNKAFSIMPPYYRVYCWRRTA